MVAVIVRAVIVMESLGLTPIDCELLREQSLSTRRFEV